MPLIRPRPLLTALVVGVLALPGAPGVAQAQASGAFAAPPNLGTGTQEAAVFLGGSVDQLEAAARGAGANGVWAQDSGGRFQLLVVGGPSFLREAFAAPFPAGFASSTAVTLTRAAGGAPPPAIVTSTPTAPRPASPGAIPGPSTND